MLAAHYLTGEMFKKKRGPVTGTSLTALILDRLID